MVDGAAKGSTLRRDRAILYDRLAVELPVHFLDVMGR